MNEDLRRLIRHAVSLYVMQADNAREHLRRAARLDELQRVAQLAAEESLRSEGSISDAYRAAKQAVRDAADRADRAAA